jgi:hypothetical protein
LWGRLNGRAIPTGLPPAAEDFLRSLACDLIDDDEVPEAWITTLADEPHIGAVRPEVERLPALVLNESRDTLEPTDYLDRRAQ